MLYHFECLSARSAAPLCPAIAIRSMGCCVLASLLTHLTLTYVYLLTYWLTYSLTISLTHSRIYICLLTDLNGCMNEMNEWNAWMNENNEMNEMNESINWKNEMKWNEMNESYIICYLLPLVAMVACEISAATHGQTRESCHVTCIDIMFCSFSPLASSVICFHRHPYESE